MHAKSSLLEWKLRSAFPSYAQKPLCLPTQTMPRASVGGGGYIYIYAWVQSQHPSSKSARCRIVPFYVAVPHHRRGGRASLVAPWQVPEGTRFGRQCNGELHISPLMSWRISSVHAYSFPGGEWAASIHLQIAIGPGCANVPEGAVS